MDRHRPAGLAVLLRILATIARKGAHFFRLNHAQIDQLNKNTTDIHKLLIENIGWLADMKNVYQSCKTTLQK